MLGVKFDTQTNGRRYSMPSTMVQAGRKIVRRPGSVWCWEVQGAVSLWKYWGWTTSKNNWPPRVRRRREACATNGRWPKFFPSKVWGKMPTFSFFAVGCDLDSVRLMLHPSGQKVVSCSSRRNCSIS